MTAITRRPDPAHLHCDHAPQEVYDCPLCGRSFLTVLDHNVTPPETLEHCLLFHARYEHPVRWLLDRLNLRILV